MAGGPHWLVGTCGPLGGVSEVVGVSTPKEILPKPAEKLFSITIFGPSLGVSDPPPPPKRMPTRAIYIKETSCSQGACTSSQEGRSSWEDKIFHTFSTLFLPTLTRRKEILDSAGDLDSHGQIPRKGV